MSGSKNSKKRLLDSKRKLVAKYDPKSPISEQYRTIRTNILYSSIDEEIRSIMVTSSGPGEGKSTTTANLAVVFAQQGKTVLLVDADLRKPTVHYTFKLTNQNGLTTVLTNQVDLMEAVNKTDENNLYVLSSGPIPPNPSELLGSKAMQHFMSKALEEFDFIIFDTPPVLAVTDAQILSNLCQGSVLVVSSGKTEKDSLLKTKDLLNATNGRLLGVVLNNKKVDKKGSYYYYGTN
ncbi:polysaccharide biosynthesis tyrosine autokinase [Niallia circulans]|uniref:non-specific protein-tyrosine kinase n=1 Tax=Niallia circulans TaxID=1397 RepID=A0A553SIL0_NIACI|nr:CpsD/CapB family tyrosine-protein kinase [Niallia circulans]TRZ36821.1 polysaccharide biosynthesis tyrosine autokinase [Niallia circulans]